MDLDGGDLEGLAGLHFQGEGGDGVGAFFLGSEVEFEGLVEVVVVHPGGDELEAVDFGEADVLADARTAEGDGDDAGFTDVDVGALGRGDDVDGGGIGAGAGGGEYDEQRGGEEAFHGEWIVPGVAMRGR